MQQSVVPDEKKSVFLPTEECEKNVRNGKYSGVEVWIGIGGVEMRQRLKEKNKTR